MPPEEIERLAALHGMPVEHFADHSIVHMPDGPMPIAHGPPLSAHPSAVLPPRDGASTSAPAPHRGHARTQHIVFADDPGDPIPGGEALQTVRHLDDLRAQAAEGGRQERIRGFEAEEAAALARIEAGGRLPDEAHARDVEYVNARAPQVGTDGALPPETQRALDADREIAAQRGELSGMIGSGAVHRAAAAHGVAPRPPRDAARVTASPEARDRAAADLMTQRPDLAYGPESIVGAPAPAAPQPPGAAVPVSPTGPAAFDAIAASARPGFVPSGAAVEPAARPQSAWVDDGIMGAPRGVAGDPTSAPIAQSGVAPSARSGGSPSGVRRVGGAIPTSPTQPGMALPPVASDQMIGQLAGDYAPARRAPDLVDRQQFLDQQTAAAGREDAIRQAAAEREAEQQRQQLEQDRAHAMLGARQAYQNAVDRVASAHIDPSRWFRDQGAGGTIAATLAVGLGALGQAFSGGDRNLALEEINQAIDRDIEAQGADIESGRAAADMQGNMLGIMRSEYGDRDAAREAARAAMLRQVALQTQAHSADLADDEARLHADQTRAQLEQAANEADADAVTRELAWRQSAAQTARLEAQAAHEMRLAHPGGAVAHPPTVGLMNAFRDWMALHPEASPDDGWAVVGGTGAPPTSTASPADVQAIAATDAALSDLERQLGDVTHAQEAGISGVGMVDSALPRFLAGSEGRRMRQRAGNVLESFLHLQSGAAVSTEEYERASERYGIAPGSTEEEFIEGTRALRAELDARRAGMVSTGTAPDRDLADVGGEWVE